MKKFVSIILAIIIATSVFTVVPITVSATETESEAIGADSGTTGDCTWTLDDEGTLTISGNGDMDDYDSENPAPWDPDAYWGSTKIKKVIIENGVTSIGWEAFRYCSGLESVTIPDSVTEIGGYAFDCCTALTSVNIPNGVTIIGNKAFSECSKLKTFNIPDSVTNIVCAVFD